LAIGTVSGAALGTGNAFIEAYGIKSGAGMAAVYGATGAGSGALNAGVHHGNIAAGAIAGGALGVLGSTAPTYLPILDDGWPAAAQVSANRILTASASGAVLGGAEAAMSGGNIGEGARRGAEAGAMGGAFNLAVGLGVGFYSSGWRGPTSIDRRAGAIYFENALPDTKAYPGVSIAVSLLLVRVSSVVRRIEPRASRCGTMSWPMLACNWKRSGRGMCRSTSYRNCSVDMSTTCSKGGSSMCRIGSVLTLMVLLGACQTGYLAVVRVNTVPAVDHEVIDRLEQEFVSKGFRVVASGVCGS